jgi:hypothetical protein
MIEQSYVGASTCMLLQAINIQLFAALAGVMNSIPVAFLLSTYVR